MDHLLVYRCWRRFIFGYVSGSKSSSISSSVRVFCAWCKHVLRSRTILLWKDVSFKNYRPYILSLPGVFLFCIFLCVALSDSTCIIIITIIIYSFRVFHISVSWWFFTGVWVTSSLLKSPGLFSVFWLFSIMLSFGWSPLPLFTVPKAPITISIIFTCMFHSFFNSQARSRYLSFFSHSFSFILWSAGTAKSTILQFLFVFVDYYYVWISVQDSFIWMYVKVP